MLINGCLSILISLVGLRTTPMSKIRVLTEIKFCRLPYLDSAAESTNNSLSENGLLDWSNKTRTW